MAEPPALCESSPLHQLWQAVGLDFLDWCHTHQPVAAARWQALAPRLAAAGLDLPAAQALDLLTELLQADEPPLPQPQSPPPRPARPAPTGTTPPALQDDACRAAVAQAPNTVVPWLLIAGYAYHQLDRPILSDGAWDALCREALATWDTVRHPHKHLITPADLSAGSLYALAPDRYPAIAVAAARRILREGVVPAGTAHPTLPRQLRPAASKPTNAIRQRRLATPATQLSLL